MMFPVKWLLCFVGQEHVFNAILINEDSINVNHNDKREIKQSRNAFNPKFVIIYKG